MKATAIYAGLAKESYRVRSTGDRRTFVDQYVYSYRYEAYEWRKAYEVPVNAERPVPPRTIQVSL